MFIKLNEFLKHFSGEGCVLLTSVRALLFDISFLMQCHGLQTYGSEELLKETHQEWANRVVQLLYSIFCLDTQQITFTPLGHTLLTDSAYWHSLADPPSKALAK
ncbi:mediator of RNA polymerase II transcription subunit 24-like [Oncorhynchus masou masou]|uniref:mediator of RNA polymerase II transcription subunit 24-like n=1 Tax=Oncorhynchus masou masou TaxID=90313 RepID=UPI0031839363